MAMIPDKIYAGDSVTWTESFSSYPATDEWEVVYSLANSAGGIEILSAASGADHLIEIPPEASSGYAPGKYRYQMAVRRGTERITLRTGTVEIMPDLSSGAQDTRSHVEKVLEAIEACIEGRAATADQKVIEIAGRKLERFSPAELLRWRDRYREELRQIERAEKIKQGLGLGNKVKVRFR